MLTPEGYFEGQNGSLDWHNTDAEFTAFAVEQLEQSSALLFGRTTFELMQQYWPTPLALEKDPVVARLMNQIKKYVVSKSLDKTNWDRSEIIAADLLDKLSQLKHDSQKDILILGSAKLANSFMELGLIDEFRFVVNPLLLGNGNPLFKSRGHVVKLRLVHSKVFQSGNVLLCYNRVAKPKYQSL